MPLILASGSHIVSSGSGLSIAPVIQTAKIHISGNLLLVSGATITTSGSGIVFTNVTTFNNSVSGVFHYSNIRSGTILNPVISGAIIDAATINNATFNPPLSITNTLTSGAQIHNPIISGALTFVSGTNPVTSGSGFSFVNNITLTSGTTLVVDKFSMQAAIPYEYYVYKNSDGLTQIRNNSGIVQYSGIDTGAVVNAMLSGANSNISVGFQPNYYSGATDIQNNGRQKVIWYGNGAQMGMKMKINSSGNTTRAANNVFDHFVFSGAPAGLVFDNARNCAATNCQFYGCAEAVSFESTNLWTELWRLTNVHFNNCVKSLIFKTPTGAGTGSYINGYVDQATFNADSSMTSGYTYMEIQDDAQVSESKFIDTRWWFAKASGIGIHGQSGATSARTVFVKPYFENFVSNNNTAVIIDPTGPVLDFLGRPIFAGSAFEFEFVNSGNVWIGGSVSTWRQTVAVSIPAGADTFSSATTVVSTTNDDFRGIPSMYVIIGGTLVAAETITVELTMNTIQTGGTAATRTITRTFAFTGTYPISLTDYQTLAISNHRMVIDSFTARVKSSAANSTGTVTIVGLEGGNDFQTNPILSGLTMLGPVVMASGTSITSSGTALTTSGHFASDHINPIHSYVIYQQSGGIFAKDENGFIAFSGIAGTTDDRAVVQGVIDLVPRGLIYIKAATNVISGNSIPAYALHSGLVIADKNIEIAGERTTGGGGQLGRAGDTIFRTMFSGDAIDCVNTVFTKQKLSKLVIECNASGTANFRTGYGLKSYWTTERTFLDDIMIHGFDIGLRELRTTYTTHYDVNVSYCNTNLLLDGSTTELCNTTYFYGGRLLTASTANLETRKANDCAFFGTVMEGPLSGATNVILTSGSNSVVFHTCSFESNVHSGQTMIQDLGHNNSVTYSRFDSNEDYFALRAMSGVCKNPRWIGNMLQANTANKVANIELQVGSVDGIFIGNKEHRGTNVVVTLINSGSRHQFIGNASGWTDDMLFTRMRSGFNYMGLTHSGQELVVGGATALPATPAGFVTIQVSSANVYMPYYISG